MSIREQKLATIALNKKAKFDFELIERIEAGLMLAGWEVKSLRAGKGQITDTYVIFKNGEAFLQASQIQPLITASSHVSTDPYRNRKLLLKKSEIVRLREAVEQKGLTVVCTAVYWKDHLVKCEIALARGKKLHDKRQSEKERDWNIDKQRLLRQ